MLLAIAATSGFVPHVVCSGVAEQWVVAFTLAKVAIPGLFGWIATASVLFTRVASAGVWVDVSVLFVAVRCLHEAVTRAVSVTVDCGIFLHDCS